MMYYRLLLLLHSSPHLHHSHTPVSTTTMPTASRHRFTRTADNRATSTGLPFSGKTWNQGKVGKLENGHGKYGISFKNWGKSRKSPVICVVLENCLHVDSNSSVDFLPTLLILLFFGLDGAVSF